MYVIYDKSKAIHYEKHILYSEWARGCKVDLTKPLEVVEDREYKWVCKTPVGSHIQSSVVHLGKNAFSLWVLDKPLEEYM